LKVDATNHEVSQQDQQLEDGFTPHKTILDYEGNIDDQDDNDLGFNESNLKEE
jgi:hypothetical protein